MRDFSGAVALVTGGGAGVGAAEVKLLAARGAQVCAVDIDEDAARRSGAALAVGADVTDREAMAAVVDRVVEQFGRLDLVICNAGITHRPATLRMCSPGEAQRVLNVNLLGALNTVQPAIDPLIASRGHAVLVSSVGALLPAAGGAIYSASKVGVEMLGRALRLELAPHGVGVTITYFGPVETAMAHMTLDTPKGEAVEKLFPKPMRKRISPEEAAAGVIRAVERGKVRTIIPARWKVLDVLRLLGVNLDNALLHSKGQLDLIRDLDSA